MVSRTFSVASVGYKEATTYGLKLLALTSIGFGGVGIVLCLMYEDIGPKMNNKTDCAPRTMPTPRRTSTIENSIWHDSSA